MSPTEPLKIFYSYPRKDKELRERLARHLRAYELNGLVRGWHDSKIQGGADWKKEIEERIGEADIVLLLMTENYQSSEWCMAEYDLAMMRHDAGKCRVIPINLRAVEWCRSLQRLNAIPPLSEPIMGGNRDEEDQAFQRTAIAIGEVAATMRNVSAAAEPPAVAARPSTARVFRPSREITRDFAFLCDWSDPEAELKAGFQNLSEEKRLAPFLMLLCGDPDDCHENFIARVQNSALPKMFGVTTVNPLRWFDWPEAVPRGVTASQALIWKVQEALSSESDEPAKMARELEAGLTIVRATIDVWSDFQEKMIESYAAFWNSWAALPPGKAVAPCVCIKLAADDPRIDALRERISFERFERLRGRIVGLMPIQQSHALNWLIRPEIKPLYRPECTDAIEREIQAIFAQRTVVRMRRVADGLTQALRNHAGERDICLTA